jgi:hypothetical protein
MDNSTITTHNFPDIWILYNYLIFFNHDCHRLLELITGDRQKKTAALSYDVVHPSSEKVFTTSLKFLPMKKASYFVLIGIIFSFFISSCTLEKRVYMSGYNIDWHAAGHQPNKHSTTKNDTENNSVQDRSQAAATPKTETAESTSAPSNTGQALYATTENNDFLLTSSQQQSTTVNHPAAAVTKNKNQSRNTLIKSLRKAITATDGGTKEKKDENSWATAGFFCAIAAIALLLFATFTPLWLIAAVLAIIFSAIGLGKKSHRGLAIAGLVIGIVAIAVPLVILVALIIAFG